MKEYDVIIIGSGVAGLSAAYPLRQAGKSVLIVEEDLWGGTCPNRGCDPKKILLSGVEAQRKVSQLIGKGFNSVPSIEWEKLQAFKRTFTDPVSENRQQALAQAGIDYKTGTAQFLNENEIELNGQLFKAEKFVIATGQRPSILQIEGKEYLKTSADFLSLDHLPEKIIFIGGGYVAFELATIAHAAGSQVTIIHHNTHPLKEFNEPLVQELVKQMEEFGIMFEWNIETKKIQPKGTQFQLITEDREYQADAIICSTGRQPNIASLNLDKANVATEKSGIRVSSTMQTSNPAIYACGDVVAKKQPKLTPVATFEGTYVANHILQPTINKITYPLIPTIVYASPKLAKVGITKEKDEGSYRTESIDLTNWFTYHRRNDPMAKAELLFDQENYLVGATVLSESADELINDLMLMINQQLRAKDLNQFIFGYPTMMSDIPYLMK
ncbi:hypothetical protein A5844_000313 [Enterococcus sp. 10A9_DIV0425]|uniref:Pyridine nucleotide-disulfide oxidoreductase n=1 Tax=Candidatus Enterococcus wittei TaxID=1987383 RepID=A0A2C9XQU4_9ENTE|nr:NAD(P)/FAD-dependent oxidoreductase [Enterococcus sp. 10A9_DIV0425]OTP12097.1 hypothetical protein A5844_000313 [Enterococcus sp. 10A9_DIV0425]THE16074.1 NAD(P)/FAD-dependent oxidoreductase [Enterococcus hirae]